MQMSDCSVMMRRMIKVGKMTPCSVAYLRGDGAMPPLARPWKFFTGDFISKGAFFAISSKNCKTQQCLMVFFKYRCNMRLKSPCEIASDMTRRRRRELLKTSWKPYRPKIFRGGRV